MAKSNGPVYQEWDVQISITKDGNGKTQYSYEKLKISRKAVKITDEEAETLNHGVLTGGNTYAKMYFPAPSGEVQADKEEEQTEEVTEKPKRGKK